MEAEVPPKGDLDLSVSIVKEAGDKPDCLCLITAKKSIYLQAASHYDLQGWMKEMEQVKAVWRYNLLLRCNICDPFRALLRSLTAGKLRTHRLSGRQMEVLVAVSCCRILLAVGFYLPNGTGVGLPLKMASLRTPERNRYHLWH